MGGPCAACKACQAGQVSGAHNREACGFTCCPGCHHEVCPRAKQPLRPVFQVPGDNQCLRCCVATLFGVPLESVPFFGESLAFNEGARESGAYGALQDAELRAWLHARGLDRVNLFRHGSKDRFFYQAGLHGYVIASGPTERGTSHAVVYRVPLWNEEHSEAERESWERTGNLGLMVHDPHPSGAGLLKVEWYTQFIVIEPSALGAVL